MKTTDLLEQSLLGKKSTAWRASKLAGKAALAEAASVTALDESRNKDETHRSVRNQYENLPYPLRDPDDDKKRLLCLLLDYLPAVNMNCWGGKRDFNKKFRVLIAGGGTGDASTFLAVQLAKLPGAEIVYVDLSTASMSVARQRLAHQADRLNEPQIMDKVDFRLASLLDVGTLDLGKFDYVNCSGVLHHLKNPLAGLQALESVLADDGVMGIMVYGQIGRTGIYTIQKLMRLLHSTAGSENDDMDARIEQTWTLLDSLPESNLHLRNGRWKRTSNRVETYDLFLHSQDRAYTMAQLHEWVAAAGLQLVDFAPPTRGQLSPAYLPCKLPKTIRNLLPQMPAGTFQSFAEYLCGGINTWEFWLKRTANAAGAHADLHDDEMIPFFDTMNTGKQLQHTLKPFIAEKQCGMHIAFNTPSKPTPIATQISTTSLAMEVYSQIDDSATLGKITQRIQEKYPSLSAENIRTSMNDILAPLLGLDVVLLRHKDAPISRLNYRKF